MAVASNRASRTRVFSLFRSQNLAIVRSILASEASGARRHGRALVLDNAITLRRGPSVKVRRVQDNERSAASAQASEQRDTRDLSRETRELFQDTRRTSLASHALPATSRNRSTCLGSRHRAGSKQARLAGACSLQRVIARAAVRPVDPLTAETHRFRHCALRRKTKSARSHRFRRI